MHDAAFPRMAHPSQTPENPWGEDYQPQSGMSMRQWYASQAMIGLVGHSQSATTDISPELVAKMAWRMADAMIAAE